MIPYIAQRTKTIYICHHIRKCISKTFMMFCRHPVNRRIKIVPAAPKTYISMMAGGTLRWQKHLLSDCLDLWHKLGNSVEPSALLVQDQ